MREEPVVITSSEGNFWLVVEATEGSGNATITVDDGSEQQEWDGFGGTFNEMGWDALGVLSQEDRDRAISLLFDYADGLGLTYGRIPVGSSDYALSRYSLNETANDYEMESFSIERDREKLIPYIHAAQAVKADIKFWASPWSPPTWMKDNGAFDRGRMKNDAQTLGAHALYLARFVEEYATEGIDISAIFPQNEAGYEQDYPSCSWSGSQMADYVANQLGPTFEERGLATEIWVGTLSNPDADNAIGKAVLGNGTAKGYAKGAGFQWGMIDHIGEYKSYGIRLWQTEHKCGNYPWEGGYKADKAPNDYAYAIESWGLLKNWIGAGVNAYAAWNMVLDTVGRSLDNVRPWNQNALLIVDRNAKQLIATPTYYVFRHLAQYTDPGAKRVSTQGGNAIAFKNPDGSIMLALYNEGGAGNITVSALGKTIQFMGPGRGWATVNVQP
jgi:glucosylceramidase